jgi:hypothetical protein
LFAALYLAAANGTRILGASAVQAVRIAVAVGRNSRCRHNVANGRRRHYNDFNESDAIVNDVSK